MANAFSTSVENLQLAWDSSSLKAVQFCPRYYQHQNLEGWQGESVDLIFGRHIADGFELFQKLRLDGYTREDALVHVVRQALEATYFEDPDATDTCEDEGCDHYGTEHGHRHDTQWGGRYEDQWKCNGDSKETVGKPYRNQKGNVAKCPFAFERSWFPGDAPSVCGECGGSIKTARHYVPEDKAKNRIHLIRALIWYGLDQPEDINDGYRPYVFPDGTKAVELSGRLPLPLSSRDGESYLLTFNFDYIGVWGTENFITDNKTTRKTLNDQFFQSYAVDTQFDTYDLIGSVYFPDLNIRGTMVDAVQVTATGHVEFGKRPFYKSEEQREEHLKDLQIWIKLAEEYAYSGYWPMNKRNCWLCPFKQVCALPPSQRQGFLKSNFKKQDRWNPLHER